MVIYKIVNLLNGKFYIGSTKSFRKRKTNHLFYLRKGKHSNLHLQRSFNKHGEDNLAFVIIEHTKDLSIREQYYIDTLNPQYNICRTAYRCVGIKASEETKAKMRLTHLKRDCKHTEDTKLRMRVTALKIGTKPSESALIKSIEIRSKPVLMLDKKGSFINEFPSGAVASRETGVNRININQTLKGHRNTAGGFKWVYKNQDYVDKRNYR